MLLHFTGALVDEAEGANELLDVQQQVGARRAVARLKHHSAAVVAVVVIYSISYIPLDDLTYLVFLLYFFLRFLRVRLRAAVLHGLDLALPSL